MRTESDVADEFLSDRQNIQSAFRNPQSEMSRGAHLAEQKSISFLWLDRDLRTGHCPGSPVCRRKGGEILVFSSCLVAVHSDC